MKLRVLKILHGISQKTSQGETDNAVELFGRLFGDLSHIQESS